MKFVKEPNKNGLVIPNAALTLCELDGLPLELHTMPHAAVVISGQMDAMELIRTAEALREMSGALLFHLAKECGLCDSCCDESCGCPFDCDPCVPEIKVPAWALDEADIPSDAKLTCEVDEDSGEIRVTEADYDYDLTDVPPLILEIFRDTGVCLGELEECLMDGRDVYGE